MPPVAAVEDEGLQVQLAASAKQDTGSTSKTVRIAQAGEGSQVAYNPLSDTVGFIDQEKALAEASKVQAGAAPGGGDIQIGDPSGGGNQDLIKYAKQFVGVKYTWGGNTPLTGMDCSGFTKYVFKKFGIDLPRISYQQGNGGRSVADGDWQAGDILAWDLNDNHRGADHVGIYLGGGYMIAAPKPGDHIKITKVWGNPWARRYL
jgi:peptidoglycan DL-endopeptidase CwlO